MSITKRLGLIAVVAILTGLGFIVWQKLNSPPVLSAYTLRYPQPRLLPEFQLQDHHGRSFTLDRLKGQWTLLSYGFTFCPDICPSTLATLHQVMQQLPAPHPQVVFISVDPERDTPARLASYVPYFDADFLGVTGTHDALQTLAQAIGIIYKKSDAQSADYTIDHGISIFLINPRGELHALFRAVPSSQGQVPSYHPDVIARDFLVLQRSFK